MSRMAAEQRQAEFDDDDDDDYDEDGDDDDDFHAYDDMDDGDYYSPGEDNDDDYIEDDDNRDFDFGSNYEAGLHADHSEVADSSTRYADVDGDDEVEDATFPGNIDNAAPGDRSSDVNQDIEADLEDEWRGRLQFLFWPLRLLVAVFW